MQLLIELQTRRTTNYYYVSPFLILRCMFPLIYPYQPPFLINVAFIANLT